jgi:large subunit ribosomal protein L20
MTRVKRGAVARQRRKKILSLTKGAIGSNSYLFRIAQQHSIKAICYAYRSRRERKRQYRSLWVTRLNAIVRSYGKEYSSFFRNIRKKKVSLESKNSIATSPLRSNSFSNIDRLTALPLLTLIAYVYKKKLASGIESSPIQ